jgi:hypothetical protein
MPAKPGFNEAESPLTWLARRKDKAGRELLSREQVAAGERLRRDFERGHMAQRVTVDWSRPQTGVPGNVRSVNTVAEASDQGAAAQERVRRALSAVGPDFADLLLDVCCFLKRIEDVERAAGWPRRSAKVVLGLALDALARHYGLLPDRRASDRAAGGQVRHWASHDYRPSLDGDG